MSDEAHSDNRGRRWPAGASVATSAASANGTSASSTHDEIYRTLRQMILYSTIAPGAWLRQQEIAAEFAVSRTPVREAFRTLAQEGLVELVPNYGARVTELSIEEFEEIYALRSGIEGLAARLTAKQIAPAQLPALAATLDALEARMHRIALPVYLREEWQFRVQCYHTTGRERLLKHVLFLREHSERYIHLAYTINARLDESFAFHRQLLAAIAANDGSEAEQILQHALRWTLTNAGPVVAAHVALAAAKPSEP